MNISSPSRKTSERKPSHLGSKIHSPSDGISPTRLASIGSTGGLTGRSTLHSTRLAAAGSEASEGLPPIQHSACISCLHCIQYMHAIYDSQYSAYFGRGPAPSRA